MFGDSPIDLLSRAIIVAAFTILGDQLSTNDATMTVMFSVFGSPILLCILGNRMFFNLKEVAEIGVNIGDWHSYSYSELIGEPSGEDQSVITTNRRKQSTESDLSSLESRILLCQGFDRQYSSE